MKKNNSVIRKLLLSILFVLVLGVMVFFGVSTVFKDVKTTLAADEHVDSSLWGADRKSCESIGGVYIGAYDGSEGFSIWQFYTCCPSGYTEFALKDYKTGRYFCFNENIDSYRFDYGEAAYDNVLGKKLLAPHENGFAYIIPIDTQNYTSKKLKHNTKTAMASYLDTFNDIPVNFSYVSTLRNAITAYEKSNLCSSLWDNEFDEYWQTDYCAIDTLGDYDIFYGDWSDTSTTPFQNLGCTCIGNFWNNNTTIGTKTAGLGCYKESGKYKLMLNTVGEEKGLKREGNITTSAACEELNKTYTIKFNVDGGSEAASITGKKAKEKIKLPETTRSGYTFDGWYNSSDEFVGDVGSEYVVTKNETLKAKWTKKSSSGSQTPTETKYTVKFDTDGGSSVSSKTGKSGTEFSLPSTKKSGYEFNGWYTSNGGFVGTTGDTYTIHSNVTLKAKWTLEEEKENTYNVSFNPNGGILSESSASCTTTDSSCEIDDLPEATREGYIFLGWSKTSSCNSYDEEVVLSSNNEKRYACWDKEEVTYAVTFNSNGGFLNGDSQMSCKTKDETCEIDNLPTAELEGHTFTGWGTNSLCAYGNKETLTLDRENAREAIKSIREGADNIKEGYSMAIFPEGTRSKDGKLREFKKGSLKLATMAKAPIVPVSISGAYRAYEIDGKFKPIDITITFAEPIYTDKLSREEEKELMKNVRDIVAQNIV